MRPGNAEAPPPAAAPEADSADPDLDIDLDIGAHIDTDDHLDVDMVLGPDGILAGCTPHYEDRPEQRRMAAAVAAALTEDRALLVEAGTGTGKTLAYLVPALLSGKRVVVSTGTRTLQDQITRHDIPLLQEVLRRRFTAVTLKGVSNYVCLRKLADSERAVLLRRKADTAAGGRSLADDFETVSEWARHTATGDRAEVHALPDGAPIWAELTNTPDTRIGPRCPFYEQCFITQARRRAENADLIVVNHHLYFADQALRAAHPGARVLPAHDAVIFDEAHQLEDVMTDHFGVQVSTVRLAQLARDARVALDAAPGGLFGGPSQAERILGHLERCAEGFFAQTRAIIAPSAAMDSGRIALDEHLFTDPERPAQEAWFRLDTALDELGAHAALRAEELSRAGDDERAEEAGAVARRVEQLRDDLAILAEQSADAFVYWGELRGAGVFLCAAPVDVSRYMRKHVLAQVPAAVLTSATLQTAGGFGYVRRRLGLDEETAEALALSSPFDYARQALLYLPRDLPDPRADGFGAAAAARIGELLGITAGRAFVLFTSHRALRDAARRLAGVPYPLLIQGDMPRATLIERFRDRPGSVLLGTGAFWEGVDVPGDALSLVIIDKLPFAPHTDPLVSARMRRIESAHGDPFAAYQLPQAALALKQGFGRLIRRRDDRGIVAILDGRMVGRGYGRVFLSTLPEGLPRTSALEQVRRWWHGLGRSGQAAAQAPEAPPEVPEAGP